MRFLYRSIVAVVLLAFVANSGQTQSVPAIGSDGILEVATWNVEWFGSDNSGPSDEGRQFANVAAVIERSAIDVWALQEITDADDFQRLLDTLGTDYDGHLAATPGYSGAQRTAFVYRTETVRPRSVDHILENYDHAFATRPPLMMEAEVTLPDTTVTMNLITLHAKCCGGSSEHERREEAATRLKNRIDFTTLDRQPVVVLGDFNDELTGAITAGRSSPYTNFLEDTDDYLFATLPLDEQNRYTWCGNSTCSSGSILDHILLTDELFDAYVDASGDRFSELLDEIGGYTRTTSDHLPVYALFDFTTGTATVPVTATDLRIEAPFPSPARDQATLRYTLDVPAAVRVELFDALGRRVRTVVDGRQAPGDHVADIDVAGLPAGLYLLRFQAGDERRTFRLARVR